MQAEQHNAEYTNKWWAAEYTNKWWAVSMQAEQHNAEYTNKWWAVSMCCLMLEQNHTTVNLK